MPNKHKTEEVNAQAALATAERHLREILSLRPKQTVAAIGGCGYFLSNDGSLYFAPLYVAGGIDLDNATLVEDRDGVDDADLRETANAVFDWLDAHEGARRYVPWPEAQQVN